MRFTLLLTFCIVCAYSTLFSQENKEDYVGTWIIVAGSNKISNKLSIPTVGILAEHKFFNRFQFGFFRTGLTYHFNPKFEATLGYAYNQLEPFIENPNTTKEYHQNIIYAEAVLKPKHKRLKLSHRYRLENRWLGNKNGAVAKLRIRYRLRFRYPIQKKIHADIFNELFVNLQDDAFNQNRLYLGLSYKITPSISMGAGYFKIHFPNAHYNYIRLGMSFKTNFSNPSN